MSADSFAFDTINPQRHASELEPMFFPGEISMVRS
jgi:hypothetical protein